MLLQYSVDDFIIHSHIHTYLQVVPALYFVLKASRVKLKVSVDFRQKGHFSNPKHNRVLLFGHDNF